jgi:hypothetical protein
MWKFVGSCPIILILTSSGLNLMTACPGYGQEAQALPAPSAAMETNKEDVKALAELVRQLQVQLQGLNSELGQLRVEERSARAEMVALRTELNAAKGQLTSRKATEDTALMYYSPVQSEHTSSSTALPTFGNTSGQSGEEQIGSLEEGLQLANQKINEQSQTKVESGSKYRLRLSGIVLLNLFSNRGAVENQDFPEFATARQPLESGVTFGGSLRQSQISLQTFGPDIAGAHTSADLRFDFAGGFAATSNGTAMGVVRIRTGTVRFDWSKTSIIAGQDQMFFLPLSPTSLVSLAAPALSYSGNLWAWSPQIRIEHHVAISDSSNLLLQAGILDSVSGENVEASFDRVATHGEQSGQPAYAARVAWSEKVLGQQMTVGIGGYYGRQSWGLGRTIDGWIGSSDLNLPLGKLFAFRGEFYRGRAVGGFGGAVGQSVFWNGPFGNSDTAVHALDSMGGWAQLKFKPNAKFEVNAAFGDDNPFAAELRSNFSPSKSISLLSKNLSPFINFIYQPRSDVVFSTEYRHLKTFVLDSNPNSANLINFAIGYIF